MPLYFGSEEARYIAIGSIPLRILGGNTPNFEGIVLKTVDDYMLQDSNDLYLTVEEET